MGLISPYRGHNYVQVTIGNTQLCTIALHLYTYFGTLLWVPYGGVLCRCVHTLRTHYETPHPLDAAS